jgi:hypothetical protein
LVASKIDFFCVEPKPFGFHRTKGTNNKIEQRNALIFARHPIGITDNCLSAMLTIAIHRIPPLKANGSEMEGQRTCHQIGL